MGWADEGFVDLVMRGASALGPQEPLASIDVEVPRHIFPLTTSQVATLLSER